MNGGRPYVLEVGLRWPPETFLCDRFEGLVARGLSVTVAGELPQAGRAGDGPAGVGLVEVLGPQGLGRDLAGALTEGSKLLVRHPRRLWRLLRAIRAPHYPCHVARGQRLARFRAWARLARVDPDIVHFEWASGVARYLPLLELWGKPVVCTTHGSDVSVHPHTTRHRHARAVLSTAFERCDVFVCVSERLRREAVALGLDPAKARVIPNGIDTRRFTFAKRRAHGGPLRIVSVGHLRWVKGYEYAIRAVALLAERGVAAELVIAGADPDARNGERSERSRILFLAEQAGIADAVSLLGQADRQTVQQHLRDADVFLQSSVSEGLPVAVLEAMASGTPVVSTEVGAIRELIEDGVEGRVVPSRDPQALADALLDIRADPARAAAMTEAARRRVETDFELEDRLQRFADLYRELSGEGERDPVGSVEGEELAAGRA